MLISPKKNISSLLSDIKPSAPKKIPIALKKIPEKILTKPLALKTAIKKSPPLPAQAPKPASKKCSDVILPALALITGIYALSLFNNLQNSASEAIKSISEETGKIKIAAASLKLDKITNSLSLTNDKIQTLNKKADNIGLFAITSALNKFLPGSENISYVLKDAAAASDAGLKIAENLEYLKNNGFKLATENKGEEIISRLEKIKSQVETAEKLNSQIRNYSLTVKNFSSQFASLSATLEKNYVPVTAGLYRSRSFLSSLIEILKSPEDQRILLMFQNPSEIRPAGGFIGSYGYITLNKANLKEIKIDDIYNADRLLDIKVVPPRELQPITKDWETRDANWFADFPTSAAKVISFIESSELFSGQKIKFAGAVAINTDILKTILETVGPITLENYGLTINKDNFLEELQYQVEAGRDKKPGQNPKKILSALAPLLIDKLKNLDDGQKAELFNGVKSHFENKDIMFYSKDWQIESFIENIGLAGEIMALPEDFIGDYLSVINANIAAGKTDAFIKEDVSLNSWLFEDGSVANELLIKRTHSGQNEKDWWYKVTNKNYLKILAPQNSSLLLTRGNSPIKSMTALWSDDYAKNKYSNDIDLISLEGSELFDSDLNVWKGEEFGKASFGMQMNTPAGESKELSVIYQSKLKEKPKNNMAYEFIYEKQSGVDNSLKYTITAPSGYKWKESNDRVFEYKTDSAKAREIIRLTLLKP